MFLKIDGIKGESKDKTHKEEIDVLSWSWGLSNSGTFHMGPGGGAGKANIQDVSITKYVDAGSADIQLACANGKHIKSAVLTVRKAGETPLEYIILTLTDVLVTAHSSGGSGGEDRLTENVTLNFTEVEYVYWTQAPTGGKGEKSTFKYNIAENTKK
jgi:type VI secretion system secreted protein Hcp